VRIGLFIVISVIGYGIGQQMYEAREREGKE
jgi:hypothetical protein